MSSDTIWIIISILLIAFGVWDLRSGYKAHKHPDRVRKLTGTFSPELGIVRGLLAIIGGLIVLVWFAM